MNPVILAQLNDFSKSNSLTLETTENKFEIYSIFSVLSGYLGEDIDPYEVHLKGNEFGLDGIAILIQGELVQNRQDALDKLNAVKNPIIEFIFFQSKTSPSYDYGNISKFFDAIGMFFNGELKRESADVADLIEAKSAIYDYGVGKRNPKISCYYIATGNYEHPTHLETLRTKFRTGLEELNIFDPKTITIEMVGAKQLQQWYRAATTAVEVEIDFPRNVVMPSNSQVEEAYIGYIDAKNLLELFTTTDSDGAVSGINRTVFYDNIRDYDPKSKINIAIKDSVPDW